MRSTGIVRRIDDLGRIVIPKEIRKSLGIRDGENLEIVVEDNNIKLFKNNILNNFSDIVKDIGLVIESLNIGALIITDRDKVTFVTDCNYALKAGSKISIKLEEMIDSRTIYKDNELFSLEFGETELKGYYLIYPIINDSNSIGSVILYNCSNSLQENELLIRFISQFLSRKIDIS